MMHGRKNIKLHSLLVFYLEDFKNLVYCLVHLPFSFPLDFCQDIIKTSTKF